jgi:hypothetical protein
MKASGYMVHNPGDKPEWNANYTQDPARHQRPFRCPPEASLLVAFGKTSSRSEQSECDNPTMRAIDVITKVGQSGLHGLVFHFHDADDAIEQGSALAIFEA